MALGLLDTTAAPKSRFDEWRYQPVPGHWDEALQSTGVPRRHWRKLAVSIAKMGARQFHRRWQSGQALIQANGITYNVYGDPQGKERPWPMDPIPFVISGDEWQVIERAIAQRATLLNAILADLYGPQRLIHQRLLPPALAFANPNFLRPCFGVKVPRDVYLYSYAADIGRSPDGQWWVITDRAQAPSGKGYALENRLVSARTLPNVFSQCDVRHLNRFFQTRRDAVLDLAPGSRSTPRVVVLTPGPYNETYFEHSYLARHWGFPLVEGADLTVRDDRVYLKTLSGLEPVDVIIRRQDDSYCDPLELRTDSLLGVAGLVQAVRSGNVVIANALGSGLVESPAHMAFLPGLCRHMLGEQLVMPSVATWWCGQEQPRGYVQDHIGKLVIKPSFQRFGHHPVFGCDLSSAEREDLLLRMHARPDQYLAQEQVELSTAPVWTESGLEARHVVLRVFATWDGRGYAVMPGGLARVSTEERSLIVSMQLGGGSKDVWVLGSAAEETAPSETPVRISRSEVEATRSSAVLPSRVADNLYWLGRYTERVESIVRMARVLMPALSGEEDFGQSVSLETGIRMLAGFKYLPPEVMESSLGEQRRSMARALNDLVYDQSRATGLGWNLKQVRRVSWQVKERLSTDTWRVLNTLDQDFSRIPSSNPDQRMVSEMNLLDRAIVTLSAFAGLLMESTTRGHGWRFLDIGRRLERGLQLAESLRHGLGEAANTAEPYLDMLLQLADSSITYRTRYLTDIRDDLVLDLLLADETNPRSVAFQLKTLDQHVGELPSSHNEGRYPLEQRLTMRLLTDVRLANIRDLADSGEEGQRPALIRHLDGLNKGLIDLGDALNARYLSHLTPSRLTSSW